MMVRQLEEGIGDFVVSDKAMVAFPRFVVVHARQKCNIHMVFKAHLVSL